MKKLTLLFLFAAIGMVASGQKNALIKEIKYKGLTLQYWKITEYRWSMEENKTVVTLMPYVNKAQSATNSRDYVEELRKQMEFPGRVTTLGNMYDSCRVSRPQLQMVKAEVQAVIGAKGDTITKYEPAVYETIETNFFAVAIPD